jgi:acyl-CoA thioesterase-1
MRKAVLIGDSIRRNYQRGVETRLEGAVEVWGPWENCRHSLWALDHYEPWVARQMAEIVHFNFGLHDVALMADGQPQILLEQYKLNLRRFIAKGRDPLTTLIWATTTPAYVPQAGAPKSAWKKRPDVEQYNAAALTIAKAEGLRVNDLHQVVLDHDYTRCLADDGIHMTPFGYDVLAEAVAAVIRAAL